MLKAAKKKKNNHSGLLFVIALCSFWTSSWVGAVKCCLGRGAFAERLKFLAGIFITGFFERTTKRSSKFQGREGKRAAKKEALADGWMDHGWMLRPRRGSARTIITRTISVFLRLDCNGMGVVKAIGFAHSDTVSMVTQTSLISSSNNKQV